MNNYRGVIKAPINTGKSATQAPDGRTYTFNVDVKTNKIKIELAVEAVFKVKVESVNTSSVKPKKKRVGRYVGKTSKVKKAIVKLKEGSSIEL